MANKKKNAPSGQITLTVPAMGFALAMLIVGGTAGYMVGKAKGLAEGGSNDRTAASNESTSPKGTVVNNTDGQLRRLSEAEKNKLLGNKKGGTPGKSPKAAPAAPVDSPYMTDAILSSIGTDAVLLADYKRAVGYMSKGNSRAARPTLIRLAQAATGKDWAEPVAAMLCDARASLGDLKEARAAIATFKKTWAGSPHLAQVWVADGKTHMHEGKRLKRAPGQDPKDPPNDNQKKSYREAIKRFDTVLKSFPGHPAAMDALLNKSALLVDLGDLNAAEQSANQLADEHPESQHGPRALSNVARNAMGQGDFPIAERIYNKLVTDFPTDRAAKAAKGQLKSLKMLGKDAPELEISEWVGDDLGSLASLRGKNVVLVFWATWCPACKRTMPSIQEFYERNKGDDFAMIAVTRNSKGQTTEKVRDYMTQNGYSFPVAIDSGASSRAYGVTGIPAAAMVDKTGKVVFRNHPAQLTDALVAKHK